MSRDCWRASCEPESEGVALDGLEIEVDCGHLDAGRCEWAARRVEGLPFVLLSIADITGRRRTEAALEESRQRLQTLFENAQDAILLADDQARYIDANTAACALTGYNRDELLERTIFDLTPEVDRAAGRPAWKAFLEEGRMEGEYRLTRKDGAVVTVEYRGYAPAYPARTAPRERPRRDRAPSGWRRTSWRSSRPSSVGSARSCTTTPDRS